jgi:hypothetical protein
MWSDVDFTRGEITIRRNWSGVYRDSEPVFFTPSQNTPIRKIRMPEELVLSLKKWKLQCLPSKYYLVFPKSDERPQDRKTIWRVLGAAIRTANEKAADGEKLQRLTVHSLRYSFASIHLMNATPITEGVGDVGSRECQYHGRSIPISYRGCEQTQRRNSQLRCSTPTRTKPLAMSRTKPMKPLRLPTPEVSIPSCGTAMRKKGRLGAKLDTLRTLRRWKTYSGRGTH